jgi:hypothetical protein
MTGNPSLNCDIYIRYNQKIKERRLALSIGHFEGKYSYIKYMMSLLNEKGIQKAENENSL